MPLPDVNQTMLVRTWFSDDLVWEQLVLDCHTPMLPEGFEPVFLAVDDPANAGLTVDEVVAALPARYTHHFLLIADERTFTVTPATVLAVSTDGDEPFRAFPSTVVDLEANLPIGNMWFAEFAQDANRHDDGVYRGVLAQLNGEPPPSAPPSLPDNDDPARAPIWGSLTLPLFCCTYERLRIRAITKRCVVTELQKVPAIPQRLGDMRPPDIALDPADIISLDPAGVIAFDCPACGRHEDLAVPDVTEAAQRIVNEGPATPAYLERYLTIEGLLDLLH